MPVDGTQPVYPPQTLTPITSTWGQSVSDAVVQKFASTTDRASKWVNPPAGSLSTIIGTGVIDAYQDGVWRRINIAGLGYMYDQSITWNTTNGVLQNFDSGMIAARTTGTALITIMAGIAAGGIAQGFGVRFTSSGSPNYVGTSWPTQPSITIPTVAVNDVYDMIPIVFPISITAGTKPSLLVQVFQAISGGQWFFAGRVHVLELPAG